MSFHLTNTIAAALTNRPRRLAVVFFHVDQPRDNPFMQMQGDDPVDYHAVIARTVRGAAQVHPEALIVMLTNETTEFDPDLPMTVIRLPLIDRWLMFERTRAQLAFTRAWDAPAIHIDTDILLLRRFDEVFAAPFDIGLTYRPEIPGMHINGGMLLCRTPENFGDFMANMLDLYGAIADQAMAWAPHDLRCFRGGQIALAAMMFDRRPGLHEMAWGNVLIVDAMLMNCTYEPGMKHQPFAVHFKGARKQYLVKEAR